MSGSQCCHLLPSVGAAWNCSLPVNLEHFCRHIYKNHTTCVPSGSLNLLHALPTTSNWNAALCRWCNLAFVRAPCINYRVSIRRMRSSKIAPAVWLLSITGRFCCSWFPTLNTELHRISVGVRVCVRVHACICTHGQHTRTHLSSQLGKRCP